MKGIILAGGTGSRLRPLTTVTSKQLLPVYDKPMVYYPLSVLMLAGIEDFLVITAPEAEDSFRELLGDGSHLGLSIQFVSQPSPDGVAQAFLIGEEFLAGSGCALILGDNLFYGHGFSAQLRDVATRPSGATIFAYQVADPQRFGIIAFDADDQPVAIDEKPLQPRSNWAITGLYFADNQVVDIAKEVSPSDRAQLEITSILQAYLDQGTLAVEHFGRGFAWLDAGTFGSLVEASELVRVLEHRQGVKIGCPEEIAWRMSRIDDEQLERLALPMLNSGYGEYLLNLLKR